jgi:putative protease
MADFKVGKITHYFDKIGVAVLELVDNLAIGDTIRVARDEGDLTMPVASMQIEHEQIQEAKKGQTVGLKVTEPVRPGDDVFKVS